MFKSNAKNIFGIKKHKNLFLYLETCNDYFISLSQHMIFDEIISIQVSTLIKSYDNINFNEKIIIDLYRKSSAILLNTNKNGMLNQS